MEGVNVETPGQMIRRYRDAAGLTQQDVTIEMGVSPNTPSLWERDKVRPNRANAEQLDQLLDAGGEILAICGFGTSEELVRLARSVEDHGLQLRALAERLAALERRGGDRGPR